jgi:hypothetical protein
MLARSFGYLPYIVIVGSLLPNNMPNFEGSYGKELKLIYPSEII